MSSDGVPEERESVRGLPEDELVEYLRRHSHLPGPRANLRLLDVFAREASRPAIERALTSEDEFVRSCGVAGLGVEAMRSLEGGVVIIELVTRLRGHATDGSWRVREAVAMALQSIGDADRSALRDIVRDWVGDTHPLVQRAAIAGICEPRLLDAPTAAAALDVCQEATDALLRRPVSTRRDPDVRTLRQALGYCWSVAIAADPSTGMPRFDALLATADADVAWIVKTNLSKARLARLR